MSTRLLADLRAQWTAQGRASEFDELKACLLGQAPAGGYAAVAARLGTSEGAVKTAVHRLDAGSRPCYARVAETVSDGGIRRRNPLSGPALSA